MKSLVEPLGSKREFYTPTADYSATGRAIGRSTRNETPTYKIEIYKAGSLGSIKQKMEFSSRTISQARVQQQFVGLSGNEAEVGKEAGRFVKSIQVSENEEMTSQCELVITNPEFLFTKNQLLGDGDHIVISLGYGKERFANFNRFVVVRSHPHFTRNGIPTINIVGRDGRYMMVGSNFVNRKRGTIPGKQNSAKPPTSFRGTDSDIIDQIAYYYGWAVDVDVTSVIKTRIRKKDTSMWEFVLAIAKANNYTTWVDWTDFFNTWVLHFRKKLTSWQGGREFEYRSNTSESTLLEFHPTKDTNRQVTDIEIVSFDRKTKYLDKQWLSYEDKSLPPPPPDPDEFEGTSLASNAKIPLNFWRSKEYGAELVFKLEGRLVTTFSNRPFKNKKQAKEYVARLVNEYQSDFMTANATVLGTENLRPRQIHAFSGIDEYSGYYYITDTTQIAGADHVYETGVVCYRIPDSSIGDLIRRGQVTQKWQGPSSE